MSLNFPCEIILIMMPKFQFFRYHDGIIPACYLQQIFHFNLKNDCCACPIHNNFWISHAQQIVVNVPFSTLLCMWHAQQLLLLCMSHAQQFLNVTCTTNCCACDIQKLLGGGGVHTNLMQNYLLNLKMKCVHQSGVFELTIPPLLNIPPTGCWFLFL